MLDVCVCPEGTLRADGGADCIEYDGGAPLSCAGGAAPITVYADADGDGHGNPETERMGCPGEPDTSMLADDCDDACETCHPGGTEICDGEDNDCAAGPDDTFACVQGTTTACTTTCGTTGTGACSPECTMPGACTPPSETCNELDDDCDELVDEGVIALGDRIEYMLEGAPLMIVASMPGLAMVSFDSRGIHVQRFGSDGTLIASHLSVVAGDFSTAAASASGSERAVVAGIARSTAAITIAEIDLRTGEVSAGPRNVGTRTGGGREQIRIVASAGLPVVVYSSGSRIFARGGTWTGGFTEREVASGVDAFARFDAIADPTALSSVYVAFAAYPDGGTTNREIMVQRISGFGEAQGTPYRATTNGLVDTDPTLSWGRTGLNIVWFQGTSVGAVVGVASVQVVSPSVTDTWMVRGDAQTTEPAVNVFGWMRVAQRGPGLTVLWTGSASSADMAGARVATVAPDGTMIGSGLALDSSEAMTFSYSLTDDGAGLIAFYLAIAADETAVLYGRRLICP